MTFKVGDKVRVLDWTKLPNRNSWATNDRAHKAIGKAFTVTYAVGDLLGLDLRALGGMESDTQFDPTWVIRANETKLQRTKRVAAEKRAKAAAAKAKALAEKAAAKAKADRAKILAKLSDPARKATEYLDANPGAFGCQRAHVVAIVEALTGCKLPS